MLIGYARVSTTDQNLTLQKDALEKAGCERIYEDELSFWIRKQPNRNPWPWHFPSSWMNCFFPSPRQNAISPSTFPPKPCPPCWMRWQTRSPSMPHGRRTSPGCRHAPKTWWTRPRRTRPKSPQDSGMPSTSTSSIASWTLRAPRTGISPPFPSPYSPGLPRKVRSSSTSRPCAQATPSAPSPAGRSRSSTIRIIGEIRSRSWLLISYSLIPNP